jgi:DNA-directed RNA polymerase subunit beta'
VDVAQDVTIMEEDCGTVLGLEVSALKEGEDVVEPLKDRIVGSWWRPTTCTTRSTAS